MKRFESVRQDFAVLLNKEAQDAINDTIQAKDKDSYIAFVGNHMRITAVGGLNSGVSHYIKLPSQPHKRMKNFQMKIGSVEKPAVARILEGVDFDRLGLLGFMGLRREVLFGNAQDGVLITAMLEELI